MSNTTHQSVYNLRAVLRETGLKADLVRAWERRYGLPQPQRSEGGHRLYSRYDIETLKWLKEKQNLGLSIGQAVELWKSIAKSGEDPLATEGKTTHPGEFRGIETSRNIVELRHEWITACASFDNRLPDEILNQAFATHPVETVVTELMQKGMREIGRQWHEGSLSAQQEHFASSIIERRLQTLLSLTPPPTREPLVLLGCPPLEQHVLPVMILNLFLRRSGYKVIYLGADIPVDHMVETARKAHPDLIILAAQTIRSAATLLDAFSALQSTRVSLAYGGLIFNRVPAIRNSIPGYFLGEELEDALNSIEHLLTVEEVQSANLSVVERYSKLIRKFQEKRSVIEYFVLQRMAGMESSLRSLEEIVRYFSHDMLAAIKLGDPAYLESDMDWVKLLLDGRNIHSTYLKDFIKTYRDGIAEHLGEEGAPLTNWLDSIY